MTEYRSTIRCCPRCTVPMTTSPAGSAEVDVCPDCSGVWVDWTDGELPVVARRMGPLPAARPGSPAGTDCSCPECQAALVEQPLSPGGPLVHRCGECGGAFLPLATVRAVASLGASADEPVPDETPALTRLLDALHRWFVG